MLFHTILYKDIWQNILFFIIIIRCVLYIWYEISV